MKNNYILNCINLCYFNSKYFKIISCDLNNNRVIKTSYNPIKICNQV